MRQTTPLLSRVGLLGMALVLVVALLIPALVAPTPAAAHPLGNFSVNRYSRLELYSDLVRVRYVLDLAEIPAFQERGAVDTDHDGELSAAELDAYAARRGAELLEGVTLTAEDGPVPLELVSADITLPQGQGGLNTLRLALWFEGEINPEAGPLTLSYRDGNEAGRLGWQEIVVESQAPLTDLGGGLTSEDLSDELRTYPDDRLKSPLAREQVQLRFTPAAAAPAPALPASALVTEVTAAPDRPGGALAGLISVERLTVPVLLLSLVVAAGFGSIHALEPGHGKTLVAAYFVGTRGTAAHALLLGLIVAVTHTIGVFAIGVVTLVGSRYILPEDLYPWLGAASGLLLFAIGVDLLRRRVRAWRRERRRVRAAAASNLEAPTPAGAAGHAHSHDGAHEHGHTHTHEHGHTHGYDRLETADEGPPWRSLLALGLADGLVPTPSTLVVLLAAISLDRIGIGLLLIAAFSVGFGAVLTLLALAFLYGRRTLLGFSRGEGWLARLAGRRPHPHAASGGAYELAGPGTIAARLATALPIGAAAVLISVGIVLTARALGDTAL